MNCSFFLYIAALRALSLRTGDRCHCFTIRSLLWAWYFLSSAKESTQRTPPKPMVQESFPRLKRRLYRPPFAPRIGLCKIYAVLSYRLCVPIRDALCACAGLAKQGKPLRLLCGGVRARRPTQSQKLDSVGADDPVAVPKISMLPCGCRMKF